MPVGCFEVSLLEMFAVDGEYSEVTDRIIDNLTQEQIIVAINTVTKRFGFYFQGSLKGIAAQFSCISLYCHHSAAFFCLYQMHFSSQRALPSRAGLFAILGRHRVRRQRAHRGRQGNLHPLVRRVQHDGRTVAGLGQGQRNGSAAGNYTFIAKELGRDIGMIKTLGASNGFAVRMQNSIMCFGDQIYLDINLISCF